MSLDNPYAPPLADPTTVDDVTEYPELARRLTRFAAVTGQASRRASRARWAGDPGLQAQAIMREDRQQDSA